jgi:hypothetical protein
MSVIGLRFRSFEAKREQGRITPQIKINSVPKITDVKETNIPMFDKKALSVDFEFVTEYNPNIGNIKMSGELYFMAKDNKEVMKSWKNKKEVPEDMRISVLNHLFRACLIKIANLADDLQLPPPMAIPRVKPKGK